MPGVQVDYLESPSFSGVSIPLRDFRKRTIQYYQAQYAGGEWNPDTAYNWIPGAFRDFTPRRADSRIRFTARVPSAWVAAGHAITHWYFYAASTLYWYWSESGTHIENAKTWQFEVPSWGSYPARIGLQMRSYANDNHEMRLYTTYYWNGTGRSAQNSTGHMIIEEIYN